MKKYEWQLIDKGTAHEVAYGECDTLEEAQKAADSAVATFEGRYKLTAYSDDDEWYRFRSCGWRKVGVDA